MERVRFRIDPFVNDPGAWSASLVNLAEIVVGILDGAGPQSVVEVGAYAGDLTGLLLDWADESGARITAIDPSPQPELVKLAETRPNLELVRRTSLEALPEIPPADAVIIDGDHNYWTVSEELRLIAERAAELPLLMFHDVCWPHARRDDYFAPEQVPEDFRQPVEEGGRLYPGVTGLNDEGGLAYKWPAVREGGPRNGVLTALEDFVEGRDDVRLAIVPAFYGLGVLCRRDAPWSQALADLLEPYDRNPLLERLERNRVLHLASSQKKLEEAARANERAARQEKVLRRLLASSAFGVAERLSRLRDRLGIATAHTVVSKDEIRRALRD